ncbi:NAD(P)/FAD-dependent oxidoreductase [Ignicoccus hospitalis]|uniref:FAD dependent oxidoreductase n=1 Tax=Ignicoccus hospitalis (strain KIN4/I / DSM 18386 / JCM 14125) TaxID=453591 RepID=A8A9C6_IGNH4|nr:NAD(P)/FAD-dependent oxidoreductase [Ignicoccus hospitalis]ABU81528.1 FAD dependent oxidoreductase [Ignicoccus hospitalis KIN4/I]HIH90463.1 NAD(P)/FAD-dependent oxidoreductase [Desulfurococcaceae archaeon]
MKEYDVLIVGAGPAGMFAAHELATLGEGKLRVGIIEKGYFAHQRKCPLQEPKVGKCTYCEPCHIIYGVGGAGTLSSGLINLRPDVGGDLHELVGSWEKAWELIEYVDQVFLKFGAPPDTLHEPDPEATKEIEKRAAKVGAKFVPIRQRHIGTDNSVKVIDNMTKFLQERGVDFIVGTTAIDVDKINSRFVVKTNKGEFTSKLLLLAPGRGGADWFVKVSRKLGVELEPGPLDVGVRVEVPAAVMEDVIKVEVDPKIIIYTKTFDDKVRTFCTNHRGFVVKELYDDGTVGVNGHAYLSKKSDNTNFAFLVTINLTDPMEDTIEYGKNIAKLATRLGGGNPLVQRLIDLESGRRSTWERIKRGIVRPTLREVTPGDISMAYPYRVITNILEGLKSLDYIIPGVFSPHTLLYAPEIKYYSMKARVDRNMETVVDGLYAAGDGAGLSRGINVAAATGVIAGRAMAERLL